MSVGTCNNLDVLMHFYSTIGAHPRQEAPAVKEAFAFLYASGLIDRGDTFARTTPRGEFYLHHLLATPFPMDSYRIPPRDVAAA